jgi:hypothetical protein
MSLTGTGFSANDFIGLSFATPGGGTPSITPTSGIWWNPNESGSGYALEVQHGVLAILIFSYQTNGSPQWYYVTGPMNGNSFTGTLDKYTGGPCISCPYVGRPALAGNDGSITIQFSSTTTGTLTANGRTTTIQYMTY